MAAARDQESVSTAEAVILRRVVAARDKGDQRAAVDAWRELLTVSFDRIRAMVIRESHAQLDRQEQEDAVGLACLKLTAMARRGKGFRGTTMGEYVNLLKPVVKGACVDVQRREARHSRRRAPLHASGEAGEAGERYTREAYEAIARQDEQREQALAAAEGLRELGEDFLAWALSRLTPAQRAMIECDREGLTIEQAMRRLGKQQNAVYKLRERAITALKQLYEEWER